MTTPPPRSTLFPYTTLFRSRLESQQAAARKQEAPAAAAHGREHRAGVTGEVRADPILDLAVACAESHDGTVVAFEVGDRKSTRLNSSHANISYAVFCLKKKK